MYEFKGFFNFSNDSLDLAILFIVVSIYMILASTFWHGIA